MAERERKRISRFYKVSENQFRMDYQRIFPESKINPVDVYEKIQNPVRATAGSAGYDFFLPFSIKLSPGETALIPTGIRVEMDSDYVLLLFPRSGLGFKYRLQLDNTVGVIDRDYFFSDNEGHIMAKVTNDSKEQKCLEIKEGTGFMQGIFLPFGITEDDESNSLRNGGFGSTTENKA